MTRSVDDDVGFDYIGVLAIVCRYKSGTLTGRQSIVALRKILNASYWKMMYSYDPGYRCPEGLEEFVERYAREELISVGDLAAAADISSSTASVILSRLGLIREGDTRVQRLTRSFEENITAQDLSAVIKAAVSHIRQPK